jgi:hypothetical protein
MTMMTRRYTLAMLGGTLFSPLLPMSPARAEPLTTGMAILGAASVIMDMMKQGGEMELLVKSLSVKIDTILKIQVLTLQAIGVVDQKLSDLLKIVQDIPAETLTLGNQLGAADATKNVIRAAKDKDDVSYQEHRADLIAKASLIETSARSAVTVPSLAVAAWHTLNGITFVATREYGLPVKDDKKVRAATDDLRQTFTILLSPDSKMSQRLADVRARIAQQDKIIAENATAKAILPAGYGQVSDDQPSNDLQPLTDLTLCVSRNEPRVQTEVTPQSYCSDGMSTFSSSPCGGSNWIRESVSHRRMHVKFATRTVPGGRKVVSLWVAPPEDWQRGMWSREVNEAWGVRVPQGPRNVADGSQLNGCVDLTPFTASEHPASLVALRDTLDTRNALTVMEGNLVNLQWLCQRALTRCDEIDGGSL